MGSLPWIIGGGVATVIATLALLSAPEISILVAVILALLAAVYFARKRTVARRPAGYADPPGFAWEIVLLPIAVSVRQNLFVTLGLLVICFLIVAFRRAPREKRYGPMPLLLLAAASVVCLRTTLELLALTAAVVVVVMLSMRKTPRLLMVKSLTMGLALYMVANVAGHFAGIASPAASVRIGGFTTSAGFFGERIIFPFTRSINEATIVFAVFIVLIAARWMLGVRPRFLHVVGLFAGVYIVAGSNSRVPAVIAAALTIAVLIAPTLSRRVLPIAVPVAMAAPFYLAVVDPVIRWGSEVVGGITYLSRGQSAVDIAELGTRGPIWEGTLQFWDVAPWSGRLAGWGLNGHATSGANRFYLAGQDAFLTNPNALTTHNSFLQTMLDGGLLSLGLMVTALVVVLFRSARNPEALPQLLAVAAIGLSGVMEVVVAPAATTTPFYLLVLLAGFSTTRPKRNTTSADAGDLESEADAKRAA